jgi:aryl-phospho-beta-D-glucosidase BglC (GH1 family)
MKNITTCPSVRKGGVNKPDHDQPIALGKPGKPSNPIRASLACLLLWPAVLLAQLPTPTYGWNLGNTLEPPSGERSWGPPATEALIAAVDAAGFNSVRIPCSWDSNANPRTRQINPTYMARVKQVVDWCLARNLHVVINCHWDNGWLDSSGFRRFDSKINGKVQSYWTQIANTFKNYDSRLLFSCTNEPDIDSQAKTNVLLQYYQTFVNAVRATGGQNATRWLVLSGPSTDIDKTYDCFNTLPTDPTPGRLAVEVHYYSPFQFCLMTSDADWGSMFYFWGQGYHSATLPNRNPTWGEEDYLLQEFQKMQTKFTSKGIPVLLGEYHATKRVGYADLPAGPEYQRHLASRTYFHKTGSDTANSVGMKPFYWDTPGGFFDWTTGALLDPDNVNALTGGAAVPPPSGGL